MEKQAIEHKETIQRAKVAARTFIETQYESITTVDMSKPFKSPVDGYFIEGIVNGYGKCTVSLSTDFSVTGIGIRGDFPPVKVQANKGRP